MYLLPINQKMMFFTNKNNTGSQKRKEINYINKDSISFTAFRAPIQTIKIMTKNPISELGLSDEVIFDRINQSCGNIINDDRQKDVFSFLMQHCNSQYGIYLTISEIKEGIKSSTDTVINCINLLINNDLICQQGSTGGCRRRFTHKFVSIISNKEVINSSRINSIKLNNRPVVYKEKTEEYFRLIDSKLKKKDFYKPLNETDKLIISTIISKLGINHGGKDCITITEIRKITKLDKPKIILSLAKIEKSGFIKMEMQKDKYIISLD